MSSNQDYSQTKAAEFFSTNAEMLGFTNRSRALVMSVKEAVDNALDTCEDIGVLPRITLELNDHPLDNDDEVIEMIVEDNGEGLPPDEVENVFGQILYGSKFGKLVQSRGQQGIGISAVFLWSQKHLGVPMTIKTKRDGEAREVEIISNKKGKEIVTRKNEEIEWEGKDHGTQLRVLLPANWRSRKQMEEYLEGTALANPEAEITYIKNGSVKKRFENRIDTPRQKPNEINPHPHSATIGQIENLLEQTNSRKLRTFLEDSYIRLSVQTQKSNWVCEEAGISPSHDLDLTKEQKRNLVQALKKVDVSRPPSTPLSPLGKETIKKTLQTYNPEYMGVDVREVRSHEGHPYIIETGIAYGGDISDHGQVDYYRVANRVPLVYDGTHCSLRKAVDEVSWNRYELNESRYGIPSGPAVIFIHIASTRVPFGNEAKTWVESVGNTVEEMKLSLESCGRQFSKYVKEKRKRREHKKKVEQMTPIYEQMSEKLGEVMEDKRPDYSTSLGKSCHTIVIEQTQAGTTLIRNPTDKTRNVTVNGDEISIESGDEVEVRVDDIDEIEYGYAPVVV